MTEKNCDEIKAHQDDKEVSGDRETEIREETEIFGDGNTEIREETEIFSDGETGIKEESEIFGDGETEIKEEATVFGDEENGIKEAKEVSTESENATKKPLSFPKMILLQIIILVILSAGFMIKQSIDERKNAENGQLIEKMSSDYITYDNGWTINPESIDFEIAESGEKVYMIYGPYIPLDIGEYTLRIWYSCDTSQSFTLIDDHCSDYIYPEWGRLQSNETYLTYDFSTTKDHKGFEVLIEYNGEGTLKVDEIQIVKSESRGRRMIAGILALFIVSDILLLLHRKGYLYRNRQLILMLGGTVALSSIPLLAGGINGHDLEFHLLRIEGLANELKRGIFPVRMQSHWMSGYGYPVSIMYGDILLYLPALMRIIGFSLAFAYQLYIFMINGVTTVVSYVCFKRIFKNQNIAVLSAFVYATSSYRLMDIYIRAAVGEISAIAFFPIIALAFYNIITEDAKHWRTYSRNALILAVGMSGVIQTHILSSEMAVFVLAFVCIVFVRKIMRLNSIRVLLRAVWMTVLLNLFFLVPFIDYYVSVPMNVTSAMKDSVKYIQAEGTRLAQYFAFVQIPYGISWYDTRERMVMTPGFLLMAALVGGIFLMVKCKADRKIKVLVVLSALSLWMASDQFPWNWLAERTMAGKLLSQVQFPWRYIAVAALFLSILAGFVSARLSELYGNGYRSILMALTVVSVCITCIFISQVCDEFSANHIWNAANLDTNGVGNGEYIPKDGDYGMETKPISDTAQKLDLLNRSGSKMEFYCEAGEEDAYVILPVFSYKYYRAVGPYGEVFELSKNEDGRIRVRVPAGYSGTVTLKFDAPWYWHIAEIISALAIICFMYILIITYRSGRKTICQETEGLTERG